MKNSEKYIKREFYKWLANIVKRAAKKHLKQNQPTQGIKYYIKFFTLMMHSIL